LATNPWIIADGVTLDQYKLLFTQSDFLVFFKNTAIVTVCVVAHHHGGEHPGGLFRSAA